MACLYAVNTYKKKKVKTQFLFSLKLGSESCTVGVDKADGEAWCAVTEN